MTADVTVDPVVAAAITAGLLDKVVVDEPVDPGPITITADDDWDSVQDTSRRLGGVEPGPDIWFGPGGAWLSMPGDKPAPSPRGDWRHVRVGRVACTATVTACLPIVLDPDDLPDVPELIEADGVVRHWPDGAFHDDEAIDITADTVWQPGAWIPGRWVLVLADITPVEAQP